MPRVATEPGPVRDQRQGKKDAFSDHYPLTTAVVRSGLFGPPLCGGSAPATPPPTTCLIDLVSTLATGACSTEFRQPTIRRPFQFPVGAGLVPALALPPVSPSPSPLTPSYPHSEYLDLRPGLTLALPLSLIPRLFQPPPPLSPRPAIPNPKKAYTLPRFLLAMKTARMKESWYSIHINLTA